MSSDRILGIDLGTTNSACCIWENAAPKLIPNSLGKILTPSVVSFDHGTLVVGEIAKNRIISHPDLSVANYKRFMGSTKIFELAGKNYRPEELSAMVIKSLKEDAENYTGSTISRAVISVPAYFNDIQRKATKRAGAIAGLEVDRVINEPSAAALAYGINLESDKTFLVVDLGGGTFDVSIIDCYDKIIEIKASSGDNCLGGEDFLLALELFYLEQCGIKRKDLTSSTRQNLLSILEDAKRALSSQTKVSIPHLSDQKNKTIEITRDDFESITGPLLERIKRPIIQALRDSKVDVDEIDNVILVGGASRMPAIKKIVGLIMGRIPATILDPDTLIAAGAGIQAGLKEKNADLDEYVLTDVCPFSLGVGIFNKNSLSEKDHLFSPIIERNHVVPVSRVHPYVTVCDNQKIIELKIYQGESRFVKNNINIGEINVPVPINKAGGETVDVRFSYDMNGILDVDVTVLSTGVMLSATILNTSNDLSEEEIQKARKKLTELKFHPRDTQQIKLIMARAERLYEVTLGANREFIAGQMREYEGIIESQDKTIIEEASTDFICLIEEMEKLLLL